MVAMVPVVPKEEEVDMEEMVGLELEEMVGLVDLVLLGVLVE